MTCVVCSDSINNMFYISVTYEDDVDTYCSSCYLKTILDNFPGMKSSGTNVVKSVCECGKEKHGFASHSCWCKVKDST
jgi:hypothetical protein